MHDFSLVYRLKLVSIMTVGYTVHRYGQNNHWKHNSYVIILSTYLNLNPVPFKLLFDGLKGHADFGL